MRHVILSSVASLAAPLFRFYLINGSVFGEKVIGHKICLDFFLQLLCKTFLILRILQRDIVINVNTSSCKVSVILVRFQ